MFPLNLLEKNLSWRLPSIWWLWAILWHSLAYSPITPVSAPVITWPYSLYLSVFISFWLSKVFLWGHQSLDEGPLSSIRAHLSWLNLWRPYFQIRPHSEVLGKHEFWGSLFNQVQCWTFEQFFKKNKFIYLFIWLCWVFVSARGLSPVAVSGGHSSSWCAGLSLSRPLLLRNTGSRRAGSVVVAHGPSYSLACGIFPDQGLNPCPLHWQADS